MMMVKILCSVCGCTIQRGEDGAAVRYATCDKCTSEGKGAGGAQ